MNDATTFTAHAALDCHAHVFPDDYLDFLVAHGQPESQVAIARGLHASNSAEDIADRLEWMDTAGVATQIIAVTPQVPVLPTEADSLTAATLINDAYAQLIADHPGRFLGYGAVPLPHVSASISEIERIFGELNFLGVSIPTIIGDQMFLNDAALDPIWEALNAHHAVVNIHPTGHGACSPMLASAHLEWVNGAPIEDATATLQLLKADVPRRFPNITFHIAHLGGDLPFLAQRIEDNYTDWQAFAASPIEQLRGMYFDAANFHEPSLALAAETFGTSQILAGSDIPYFQEERYVRAFSYIRTSRLTDEDKNKILFANAVSLYGL